MRFHLIDRIDSYEKGHTIRAVKLTSHNEEYWDRGEKGLTMPRSLVLEALCQAGSWLLILSTEHQKRAALLSIGSVTYLGDVKPGAVLKLEGTILSMGTDMAVLSGQVRLGEHTILEAQDIMCTLIDADRLDEPDATRRMSSMLTREGGLL
jgi:3-hydroxyacyl-[acyl-carrier-protein] dehydratase